MKIKVPFFQQTTPLNCGPTVLRMAVAYFGGDPGIEVCEKETGLKEGKALNSMQIAIAAASLGYRVEFYSSHLVFNPENANLAYYKKYSATDLEISKDRLDRAKELGVGLEEKTFELKDTLRFLSEDSVLIFLLNWSVIKGSGNDYQGHFIVLVGYDEENVIVHNPGLTDGKSFMQIPRGVFDKARKAQGTDEDIIVIYRD